MKSLQRAFVLIVGAGLISGCGFVNFLKSYTNVNGAPHTISEEHAYPNGSFAAFALSGPTNAVREVNLASELALLSKTDINCSTDWSAVDFQDAGACLDKAVESFHEFSKADPNDAMLARNELQERLIMASNSACREFTQHLNTFQSSSNFILGALATGAGAAAAIVSSGLAANALGGSAGALSGTRAEVNADYFYNQAAPVVTRSIDDRRRTFLSALRGYLVPSGMTPLAAPTQTPAGGGDAVKPAAPAPAPAPAPPPVPPAAPASLLDADGELNFGTIPPHGFQSLPINTYPVEAAIADAIYYNDLCSLDKGLENITTALVIAKHPGLDELAAAQDSENQLLQKQLDGEKIRQQEAQLEAQTETGQTGVTVSVNPPGAFSPTAVGSTSDAKLITLTNHSSASVTIGAAIFQHGDEFLLGSDTCSSQTIAAGANCQMAITFKPAATGRRSGSVTIPVTPDPESPHVIKFRGTGK